MSSREFAPALVSMVFLAIPMVWIVAHYFHLTVKSWYETSLKRDMVARGYSASEIIDVISGSRGQPSALSSVPPAKPIRQPA